MRDLVAVEIEDRDLAWIKGEIPHLDPEYQYEVEEADEVQLFGRTYECAPGSSLYLPVADDAADRVLRRKLAERPQPVAIELFSGAGGFSLGVHEAGFDVVAAVEWAFWASVTYLTNLARPDCDLVFASPEDEKRCKSELAKAHTRARKKGGDQSSALSPDANWFGTGYRAATNMRGGCQAFFFGDVRKIPGHQLVEASGAGDEIDLLFGGPPCQGLSTANAKSCLEDPRNGLMWEFMRIVDELKPKAFLIENVPRLLTVANGALFNAIAKLANKSGYDVVANKLNACDFGVPQHRVRAIIAGTRQDVGEYQFPFPSTWALGRPAKQRPWTMHLQGESHDEDAELNPRLPREAHFDPIARTWSVPSESDREKKAAAKRARKAAKARQLDLDTEDTAA